MRQLGTPICDFVEQYAKKEEVRFHMPGHKGRNFLGCEKFDITEIPGADSLYEADGIIRQSEKNASLLFGTADTLYSTEGSSLCIRAMLCLACMNFTQQRKDRPVIVAGRNAHRVFLSAAALLDFDIVWLWPENQDYSLCRCEISQEQLEKLLSEQKNVAGVYLTSPDYLGNCADIKGLSKIAHKYGVPLLVDDAHGAYRKFLREPKHPILEGADICCDSAHKTLPVLTGGAYLHISDTAPKLFCEKARFALAMFASTSPSYLILQSLDRANLYLADGYEKKLAAITEKIKTCKEKLEQRGWSFMGEETLKLTLEVKKYGYTGTQIETYLAKKGIICEYADPDYVVFMLTPENTEEELQRLEKALSQLEKRNAKLKEQFEYFTSKLILEKPDIVLSVREAVFSESELLPVEKAVGRVLTSWNTACPPAVSPLIPGERIKDWAVEIFKYYGIDKVQVQK